MCMLILMLQRHLLFKILLKIRNKLYPVSTEPEVFSAVSDVETRDPKAAFPEGAFPEAAAKASFIPMGNRKRKGCLG